MPLLLRSNGRTKKMRTTIGQKKENLNVTVSCFLIFRILWNNESISHSPDEYMTHPDVETREQQIERMIEEAEEAGELKSLDSNSLKQSLINFEKKINKNQMMRMKYPNEPEKFMDSEVDLNSEINDLYALAASPELYKIFIDNGSMESVLGMLAHENTDISICAIGLLQELTEPESFVQCEEAICLVDSFVAFQGLELIVQNLQRLDEKNEEDATGVYNTLAIVENLVAVRPAIAVTICSKTHLLTFLLERLSSKEFDSNKLYCSEILCVLLQADTANTHRLVEKEGLQNKMDGMDALLQIMFQYRKKEDLPVDEEECVHNLFHSMCTIMRIPAGQQRFVELQGMELMIKCLKELRYAALCAVKVINYAITDNKKNAEKFVATGGLKYIFPIYLGRGLPKIMILGKKKSLSSEQRDTLEEDVICTISQVCVLLHDSKENDCSMRIRAKFLENDREKIDHSTELVVKYYRQLKATEYQLESVQLAALRAQMEETGKVEEEEAEDKEEADIFRYARRLEGGLLCLQHLSVIIAFVGIYGGKEIFEGVNDKLKLNNLSLSQVQTILREMISRLGIHDETTVSTGFERFKNLLIAWSAAIGGANT